jgi:hypothetical protein
VSGILLIDERGCWGPTVREWFARNPTMLRLYRRERRKIRREHERWIALNRQPRPFYPRRARRMAGK